MCTLHNTTYWFTCACMCILCKCIRVTQDTIHHVAQIDKSVQITTALCKKGSFMACLFSTNFSLLNRHTSTDFENTFTDHVTYCILSALEFIACLGMRGGGCEDGWTCLIGFGGKFHRSCNLALTVRDLN